MAGLQRARTLRRRFARCYHGEICRGNLVVNSGELTLQVVDEIMEILLFELLQVRFANDASQLNEVLKRRLVSRQMLQEGFSVE